MEETTTPAFPFLFGRAFIEASTRANPSGIGAAYFPSFSEGLSLRPVRGSWSVSARPPFPFLFGRAFIEAGSDLLGFLVRNNFPSFSEGLSLRRWILCLRQRYRTDFPSFSEGLSLRRVYSVTPGVRLSPFPFLFGRAFIEARIAPAGGAAGGDFPSFSEGLSLRRNAWENSGYLVSISLPFRKGFH